MIDDNKKVNDKYGHNAGDQILKGVADAMVAVFMESMVCRWGSSVAHGISGSSFVNDILPWSKTVQKKCRVKNPK